MRTIYKYPLALGMNVIDLPFGSSIEAVAQQHGTVAMWAEVNSENKPETRTFYVYGTGHPIPAGFVYVGTAFGDPFVWHIYEQKKPREEVK